MQNDDFGARSRARKRRRRAERVRSLVIAGVAMAAAGIVTIGGIAPAIGAPIADSAPDATAAVGDASAGNDPTPTVPAESGLSASDESASSSGTVEGPDGGEAMQGDEPVRALRTTEIQAADVSPMTVPAPGPGQAVLSVKVGGDRLSSLNPSAAGLAGVVLRLSSSSTNADAWSSYPWARCVSDADGDCNFVIPITSGSTSATAMNSGADPYVHQVSAPGGWRLVNQVRIAGDDLFTYRYRVTQNLSAGTTYRSTDASFDFMRDGDVSSTTESSGTWQVARDNPPQPTQCGVDYAVLMDLSSSISASELTQAKSALTTFVDALAGTPSRVALFNFDLTSPSSSLYPNRPELLPVRTSTQANAVKSIYTPWRTGGGTNWDAGLYAVGSAAIASEYDVLVVLTDGNPTVFGTTSSPDQTGSTRVRDVEGAVFSANRVKANNTRVVTIGVGIDGNSVANMAAISGPVANSDYFVSGNYGQAAATLAALAKGNCDGTIDVTKRVIPAGSAIPANPTAAQLNAISTPAPGWTIQASAAGAGVAIGSPGGPWVTGASGTATIPLRFTQPTTTAPVGFAERLQAGYQHQPVTVGGVARNAICVNGNTGQILTDTTNGGTAQEPGITINARSGVAMECTIYNREISAGVTVTKRWVVDGEQFSNAARPSGLEAQLRLTGPGAAGASNQAWGATRTGYRLGESVTISEVASYGAYVACETSATITRIDGAVTDIPLPASGYALTVSQAATTAEVTNTITCEQTLTLVKRVAFGDEPTDSWVLSATGPAGSLPGPSGRHSEEGEVSAPVSPLVSYALAESGGPATYVPSEEWRCVYSSDGATEVEVSDATVQVPRGVDVTCTLTNSTATLTLLKNVSDGSSAPGAWDLTATPEALDGLAATTVAGGSDAGSANTFAVRPGHAYTISEAAADADAPLAYRLAAVEKRNPDGTWTPITDTRITAPGPGQTAVYRFVNEPIPPLALPLTGGAATDAFVLVGGGLVLAALVGTVSVRRRKTAAP